ncbi:hypothetical protein ACFFRR_007983 [Megaselia abdita]
MLVIKIIKIFSVLAFANANADGDSFQHSLILNRDLLLNQLFFEVDSWNGTTIPDNNQECRKQLLAIHDDLFDDIYDNWGHIPTGLLNGKLNSLGNYDDCVAIKNETLEGKYCKTFIKFSDSQKEFIRIGICIPRSCDPKFIEEIFKKGSSSVIIVDQCSDGEKTFNVFTYIIFFFGFILLSLIVTSSVYDYRTRECLRKNTSMMFFSLKKNLKKTFDLSESSNDHFNCIDGMRVITMMWIMYYHTYLVAYRSHYTDFTEDTNPQKTNVLVHSGILGVDTFFCISGFLMTFISLKKLDKEGFDVVNSIISRYLRLAPLMMAVIFIINGVLGLVDGPLSISFSNLRVCKTNWWVNALMLQNYIDGCYGPSWYISADFIFHLITPVLIYGFKKYGSRFYGLIAILITISILSTFHIFYKYEFEEIITIMEPYRKDRFERFNLQPHFRYSCWLIGVSFGYFLYKRDSRKPGLLNIEVLFCWILALGTLSVKLIYPWTQLGEKSIFNAAVYDTFGKICWALSICVIIFLCEKGHGGFINNFLSMQFWKPLSRLSYTMYLVSFGVSKWNVGNARSSFTLGFKETVQMWWFDTLCSFCIAVVLHVSIELPIQEIQGKFFKKKRIEGKLKV